jgi:Zn-dependent peptidase ImmA (M78 family)
MHELAHIICEHKVSDEILNTGLIGFLRNHDVQQENEAEWLGSCLQLPRPALVWALKEKMNNGEIAEYFNASEEMVRYRINITGVNKQIERWKY